MSHYPAKILLFGEYSVITGSDALAVPLSNFSASWQKTGNSLGRHQDLSKFSQYLTHEITDIEFIIDLQKFNDALKSGYYLESDIPQGYGLGSSGAVCAAVFDRYGLTKEDFSLAELKKLFSKMEDFFHGKSSGLDPLVSFLNKPVLVEPGQVLSIPDFSSQNRELLPELYLFDSGIQRETQALVGLFHEKLNQESFRNIVQNQLVPLVGEIIQNWITGNEAILSKIREVSHWQYRNMKEYIPENVAEIWSKYLNSDDVVFKLCGAGGGGYFQVFKNRNYEFPNSLKKRMIPVQ